MDQYFKLQNGSDVRGVALEGTDGKRVSLPPNNFEGVHVTTDIGWILLRKSLHNPQIPINIESDVAGGVEPLIKEVKAFLAAFDGLE